MIRVTVTLKRGSHVTHMQSHVQSHIHHRLAAHGWNLELGVDSNLDEYDNVILYLSYIPTFSLCAGHREISDLLCLIVRRGLSLGSMVHDYDRYDHRPSSPYM